MVRCDRCGQQIDPQPDSGHYQLARGWVKLRSKGANEIALREDMPVFMCKGCMIEEKAGIHVDQGALW